MPFLRLFSPVDCKLKADRFGEELSEIRTWVENTVESGGTFRNMFSRFWKLQSSVSIFQKSSTEISLKIIVLCVCLYP